MRKIVLVLFTVFAISATQAQDAFNVQMEVYKTSLKYYDLQSAITSLYTALAIKPERKDLKDSLALIYFSKSSSMKNRIPYFLQDSILRLPFFFSVISFISSCDSCQTTPDVYDKTPPTVQWIITPATGAADPDRVRGQRERGGAPAWHQPHHPLPGAAGRGIGGVAVSLACVDWGSAMIFLYFSMAWSAQW